jgi:hypothetical protein
MYYLSDLLNGLHAIRQTISFMFHDDLHRFASREMEDPGMEFRAKEDFTRTRTVAVAPGEIRRLTKDSEFHLLGITEEAMERFAAMNANAYNAHLSSTLGPARIPKRH